MRIILSAIDKTAQTGGVSLSGKLRLKEPFAASVGDMVEVMNSSTSKSVSCEVTAATDDALWVHLPMEIASAATTSDVVAGLVDMSGWLLFGLSHTSRFNFGSAKTTKGSASVCTGKNAFEVGDIIEFEGQLFEGSSQSALCVGLTWSEGGLHYVTVNEGPILQTLVAKASSQSAVSRTICNYADFDFDCCDGRWIAEVKVNPRKRAQLEQVSERQVYRISILAVLPEKLGGRLLTPTYTLFAQTYKETARYDLQKTQLLPLR